MRRKLLTQTIAFCTIYLLLTANFFSQTGCRECKRPDGKINQAADVIDLTLSKSKVFLPCSPGTRSETAECNDYQMSVEVVTTAKDKENDLLKYNYTVSGGRIVGEGAKVFWDLSGVSPGTYTITAAVDDGCGFCGKTVTKTVVVEKCSCIQNCVQPMVSVSGSGLVKQGEPATVTANVSNATDLTYNWTLSGGVIIAGQGTPVITIDTTGLGGQNITATVQVTGGCEPVYESFSVNVSKPGNINVRPNIESICNKFTPRKYTENRLEFDYLDINQKVLIYQLISAVDAYQVRKYDIALAGLNEILTQNEDDRDNLNPCIFNIIGAIYSDTGNYQKAIGFYQQILNLAAKQNQIYWKASAETNIGLAYLELKQYSKAIPFFEKNIKFFTQNRDVFGLANTLNYYGAALRGSKLLTRANLVHKQALEIAEKNDYETLAADIYEELGRNALAQNQLAVSTQIFQQALTRFRQLGDPYGESETLLNLMEVWIKNKQPRFAIFYGSQAINLLQKVRQDIQSLSQTEQKRFLKTKEKYYRTLAELLIVEGRVAEAEQVLGMLKEEEFFEYLRRDDKAAKELKATIKLTPTEEEAFKRYEEIADEITRIGREFGELEKESKKYPVGKFPRQAEMDKLDANLADARKVFNKFLEELDARFRNKETKAKDARVAQISGTKALLDSLNQPRTVIISTIAGEDRLNLIVTTSKINRAHTVDIKAADLNKLVVEFREAVKNPLVDPRLSGKKLYDVLFPADLQKDLAGVDADTIVWSLDGTLRYAPMSALWDGEKYLVERYSNAILTLASRDKIDKTQAARTNWTALGLGVSQEFEDFDALAAVPQELCRVVQDERKKADCLKLTNGKTGVFGGTNLSDGEFTFESFRLNLGRYPVVHIASHFSLNAGTENDSYLLLGGGKSSEERKLSISAVREKLDTKFVGTELLVLSACNTAMSAGENSSGAEIEGFGALAQEQGAKTVLASLWAVADDSTRDLMTEFYEQLKRNPNTGKSEALRQSQIALLNGKYKSGETPLWRGTAVFILNGKQVQPAFKMDVKAPFAHPFYWSPFILFGNWR